MTKSKRKNNQALKFTLIEQAEEAEGNLFQEAWEIPKYISNN